MGQTETPRPEGRAPAAGIGRWLQAWRHENRWTQEQLAEALGYEVSYVSKIERGERRPTRPFLSRLSGVVETPVDVLSRASRSPTPRIRLPVPSTPLVGRDAEINHVAALVRESATVTLVGAPGIGKTRMGIEVAWATSAHFRHGAAFVALAEVGVDSVADAILGALGMGDGGSSAQAALEDALRDRSQLLVLDNFEHLLDALGVVESLLAAAPGVHVLVTSREALGLDGEEIYQVPGLAFPAPAGRSAAGDLAGDLAGDTAGELTDGRYPSVDLFVERGRLARPDFVLTDANAAAVVDICARLDGLPLAISLTAGAVRYLSEVEIAARLADRLELPTEGGTDLHAHERLATALDSSWRLLEPPEQRFLARLSVFAGGCTLAAAEAVGTETEVGDALATLAVLERKHLVEPQSAESGATRFVLLETVRRYARDRLHETDEFDHVSDRHCRYFVARCERAEPSVTCGLDQGRWIRSLQEDHANLVSAFEWAMAHDSRRALRLAAANWRFFSMWRTSDGRRWLDEALEQSPPVDAVGLRALNGAGVLARLQGDLDRAGDRFEQAHALATALGDERELALAVINQGIIEEDRGRYDPAETLFVEAAERYRRVGDERGVAHAVNCIGVVALRRDDHAAASDHFLDALSRFRTIDDLWSAAWTATNLGWISEMAGDHLDASEWYDQSRKMRESVNDDHGLAISLASLGRVGRRQEDPAKAAAYLLDALELFHRLGDRRRAAACLGELAAVAAQRRKLALAAKLVGAADGLLDRLGVPAWADESALREEVMASLGRSSGEAAVRRAWNHGRALSLEAAIDLVQAGL